MSYKSQSAEVAAGCRDEEPGWRGTAYATLLAVGMEDGDAGIISYVTWVSVAIRERAIS